MQNSWLELKNRILETPGSENAPTIDPDTIYLEYSGFERVSLAHKAARDGNVQMLTELIQRYPDVIRLRSEVGATALHDAAATGNLECVKCLIQKADCDPEATDHNGNNALHLAARYGHIDIVRWLVDSCQLDISTKNKCGAMALHFAVTLDSLDVVKYLVEQQAGDPEASPHGCCKCHSCNFNEHINIQMKSGATAAYLSAQEGHLETLRYLVEEGGASVNILAYDGMSCLHAACQMGHLDCAKWLVTSHRLKVNEKDFDGTTPLHLAVSNGHVDVITWLLDNGARMLTDNLGGTPLHDACEHGQLESVRLLTERGCDVTCRDEDGLTAAELAELIGQRQCAVWLRSKEEDITLTSYSTSSGEQAGDTEKKANVTCSCESRRPSVVSRSSQTNDIASTPPNDVARENSDVIGSPPQPPPPPPPPPALPLPHDVITNHGWSTVRSKAGAITKSLSTNTISTSHVPRSKNDTSDVDFIAELKAANGLASLKRTRRKETESESQSKAGETSADDTESSVHKLKSLISGLETEYRGSSTEKHVKLTAEFDPIKFIDHVPEVDKSGKTLPAWKRLLAARRLAIEAQTKHEESQKVEQEDAKYKNMPLWKRALLEKRHNGNSSSTNSLSSPDSKNKAEESS